MANEEKELYKFVNDPKYRSKVIAKIHKNSDNAYNKPTPVGAAEAMAFFLQSSLPS